MYAVKNTKNKLQSTQFQKIFFAYILCTTNLQIFGKKILSMLFCAKN